MRHTFKARSIEDPCRDCGERYTHEGHHGIALTQPHAPVWLVVRCTQGPSSYLEWVHGFAESEAEARQHADELQAGKRHPEVFAAAQLLGVSVRYDVRRADKLS